MNDDEKAEVKNETVFILRPEYVANRQAIVTNIHFGWKFLGTIQNDFENKNFLFVFHIIYNKCYLC